MKIYKCVVGSLFTYGSEAWYLNESTMAAINGANARCVSRITGRSVHEEASPSTRTYDLVADIRERRHKWLGHILRLPGNRLIKTALAVQFENVKGGEGGAKRSSSENTESKDC